VTKAGTGYTAGGVPAANDACRCFMRRQTLQETSSSAAACFCCCFCCCLLLLLLPASAAAAAAALLRLQLLACKPQQEYEPNCDKCSHWLHRWRTLCKCFCAGRPCKRAREAPLLLLCCCFNCWHASSTCGLCLLCC
jgi:hypothetical protein